MAEQSLMLSSALNILVDDIPYLFDFEKRVIHRILAPHVMYTRYRNRGRSDLSRLCNCGINGECLCYFIVIRNELVDEFWGDIERLQHLGDLCRF